MKLVSSSPTVSRPNPPADPAPYTVALIQSGTIQARDRSDVRRNVDRAIEIVKRLNIFCMSHRIYGTEDNDTDWAPVRLVHFPESFLQGFLFMDESKDFRRWKDTIAIEIPGEETEALAAVARERGLYLSGVARERVANFPGHIFNCDFIIDPKGTIIHRYRKFSTFMLEISTSPHDVWDRYLAAFRRPGQSLRELLFPVARTDIGNIGRAIT